MKRAYIALFLLILSVSFLNAKDEMFKIALKYASAGKIDEAIQILSEDVAENPTAERYLALGVVYLQKKDYDAAFENLKEAVKLNPYSAPARYSLAMLYEKKKMYTEAINEWKKFLPFAGDKELRHLAKRHIKQLEIIQNESR